jgi:hypothetical protein
LIYIYLSIYLSINEKQEEGLRAEAQEEGLRAEARELEQAKEQERESTSSQKTAPTH